MRSIENPNFCPKCVLGLYTQDSSIKVSITQRYLAVSGACKSCFACFLTLPTSQKRLMPGRGAVPKDAQVIT